MLGCEQPRFRPGNQSPRPGGFGIWTTAEVAEYHFSNLQLATRLPNGNTIINQWFNQWSGTVDLTHPPVQAIELTPDKKVVWALRSLAPPRRSWTGHDDQKFWRQFLRKESLLGGGRGMVKVFLF